MLFNSDFLTIFGLVVPGFNWMFHPSPSRSFTNVVTKIMNWHVIVDKIIYIKIFLNGYDNSWDTQIKRKNFSKTP